MIPLWAKALGAAGLVAAAIWGFMAFLGSVRADERSKVTAEFTAAEREAEIADLKSALVEAKNRARQTEESNADLSEQLAGGFAERDAYVERMLRAARQSAAQGAGQAGVAGAAGVTVEADRATLVDDVRICETNTKRLINAAEWYEKQRALPVE